MDKHIDRLRMNSYRRCDGSDSHDACQIHPYVSVCANTYDVDRANGCLLVRHWKLPLLIVVAALLDALEKQRRWHTNRDWDRQHLIHFVVAIRFVFSFYSLVRSFVLFALRRIATPAALACKQQRSVSVIVVTATAVAVVAIDVSLTPFTLANEKQAT